MPELTDTEVVEWLEERVDEVSVVRRRLRTEPTFTVTWCADATGCQVEVKAQTLRGAVTDAISVERMALETLPPDDDDDDDDYDEDFDDDEDDDEDNDE